MRFTLIYAVAVFSLNLHAGTVQEVFRFARPTPSGRTLLVAEVMYEGQELSRLRYALARERDGRIVDPTGFEEGLRARGFLTANDEFHASGIVSRTKPGRHHTASGRRLTRGNVVSLYADVAARNAGRITGRLITRWTPAGEQTFKLDGRLAGEDFRNAALTPVERRLSFDTRAAHVYRIKDRRSLISFRDDGADAGDVLLVFAGRAITSPLVAIAAGGGFTTAGGNLIGFQARLVLGRDVGDGIRPLAVAGGLVKNDLVRITENTQRSDQDLFTFDLKEGRLRVPGQRAISFAPVVPAGVVPVDSIYRFVTTAGLYGDVIPEKGIPRPHRRAKAACPVALADGRASVE